MHKHCLCGSNNPNALVYQKIIRFAAIILPSHKSIQAYRKSAILEKS